MNKYKYIKDLYDLKMKETNEKDMVDYMMNRTVSMFRWNGLPKTIPEKDFELFLQSYGFVLVTEHDDNLFCYYGGLGGEPDQLYRPTIATIANPAQRWDAQLSIKWDEGQEGECVICRNDPLLKGMIPLHKKYATVIAENELSLYIADILTRAPWLLSAADKDSLATANDFIDKIFKGELSIVTDGKYFDGVKEHVLNGGNREAISSLIDLHQYYKAEWFNSIGLNAIQNGTKKEAISDSEEQMNQDVLQPLMDTMLECRQLFCKLYNEKYGEKYGELSVEFNSTWEDNAQEIELEHEVMEAEAEQVTNPEEPAEESATEVQQEEETQDEPQEEETQEEETQEDDTQGEEILEQTIEEIKEQVEEILEEVKDE